MCTARSCGRPRPPLRGATDAIYMGFLRHALKRLNFQRPILWLFMPEMEIFVGRFDEKLVIYHIVDEYAGYSGVSTTWRPVMQQMEEQLARRADIVFVTSPDLLERKSALNARTILVPNAVDYQAFAAAADGGPGMTPPADMANIRPPVAGYVGAINDKLDLALLARVARASEQWSFVLVGPVTIQAAEGRQALEALRTLPHVHFLGPKDVAAVPGYVAACDVCLLPYRINEWTKHIDSLKLYEYLACGKPVVATDLPLARRFSQVVRIVTNEGEFVSGMNDALKEDSPALQARRRQIAAQNTWEQRVAVLSAAIEECLSPSTGVHGALCKEGEKQYHGR